MFSLSPYSLGPMYSRPSYYHHPYEYGGLSQSSRYPAVYMDPYGAMFREMERDLELADRLVGNIFVPLSHALAQGLNDNEGNDQKPRRRAIEIKDEKDRLQILFDVSQYKPEELSVKTVEGALTVEGKHEEKDEKGKMQIKRQFCRQFKLPKNIDPQSVVSTLSKDGLLIVEAPKKALPPSENERVIAIKQLEEPAAAIEQKKGEK